MCVASSLTRRLLALLCASHAARATLHHSHPNTTHAAQRDDPHCAARTNTAKLNQRRRTTPTHPAMSAAAKREAAGANGAEEPDAKKPRADTVAASSVAASSSAAATPMDGVMSASNSPQLSSASASSAHAHASNGHAAPASSSDAKLRCARKVLPDSFDVHECFYPRAVNSNLHPMVASFLSLGNERIIERYVHLNPSVSAVALTKLLTTPPRYFRWSGADLFNVTNVKGKRQMILIETNSCPSGQKSMPMTSLNNDSEEDGYHILMRTSFKTMLEEREQESGNPLPKGGLAVIYDKNPMEACGYASAMADVFKEPVYLAELYVREKDAHPPVEWRDDVMHVRDSAGEWHPIRACFRYVTQRPWDRIPMSSKTLILNSVRNTRTNSQRRNLHGQLCGTVIWRMRCPRIIGAVLECQRADLCSLVRC